LKKTRLFGIAFFLVLLASALLCGCGGVGPTSANRNPGGTQAGGVSSETKAQEQVIYDYYSALNDRNYKGAYDLTSAHFRSRYGSLAEFTAYYKDFITSVKVSSLKKLDGLSTLQKAEFATNYLADYVKSNPPATGYLPPINTVVPAPGRPGKWLIYDITTGP
jgi:hypothetical protein